MSTHEQIQQWRTEADELATRAGQAFLDGDTEAGQQFAGQAAERFASVIEVAPEIVEARVGLAAQLSATGKHDAAVNHYAVAMDSLQASGRQDLLVDAAVHFASALIRVGDLDRAGLALEQVKALDMHHPLLQQLETNLQVAQSKAGRTQEI